MVGNPDSLRHSSRYGVVKFQADSYNTLRYDAIYELLFSMNFRQVKGRQTESDAYEPTVQYICTSGLKEETIPFNLGVD